MNRLAFAQGFRAAALVAGVVLLQACSGTLLPKPPPPPARFTLDAAPSALPVAMPPATAPVLTVNLPRAAAGYDSPRMVYLRRPQELQAFAFHEWVAAPAQMLALVLVRGLQSSGAFRVVLAAPAGAPGSWRLQTEQLRLHQDFTQQPSQVRLSLRAVLLDGSTRQALASREFDVSVAAASEDPVAGAQAAQTAAHQLAAAVAAFCAEQVAASR